MDIIDIMDLTDNMDLIDIIDLIDIMDLIGEEYDSDDLTDDEMDV